MENTKILIEFEVTPEMIYEGLLAFHGEVLSWEDSSEEERNRAVEACFLSMLKEMKPLGKIRRGNPLSVNFRKI